MMHETTSIASTFASKNDSRASLKPLAPPHVVSELIRVISEHELDFESIMTESGLSPHSLTDSSLEVTHEIISRCINSLWNALDDEGGGISGARIPRGAYLMMGRLAVHQPTLRKALELGFRFYSMVTAAYSANLREENDIAFIEFKLLPSSPTTDPYNLFTELLIMSWHRFSCFLIDQYIPLDKVYFNYDAPSHVHYYPLMFPGTHIFNSTKVGFSFPSAYLDKETVQSDDAVKEFMNELPLNFFKGYSSERTISGKILKLLTPLVRNGLPNVEVAAQMLNMTARTLNRKLKAEHTSYQRLKDLVRRDEAIKLLSDKKIPIKTVSELLRYSEPAVFSRAFLAWTGESPSEYRSKVKCISS